MVLLPKLAQAMQLLCSVEGGANFATGATVVDGYTLKFSDKKVDMLGNVTITDSYVASSGGTASYVTCGADNALTTGAGNAASSYWEAHEVTITEQPLVQLQEHFVQQDPVRLPLHGLVTGSTTARSTFRVMMLLLHTPKGVAFDFNVNIS